MDKPYTVSELAAILRDTLEETFASVAVVGELANLSRPPSGHLYFTLKDAESQLACTCWKSSVARLAFRPETGKQVVASGRITFYGPGGKCQMTVSRLQPVGVGAAELARQQLLAKLRALGWFDEARKKPLPRFPRRVALVTSASGAAVRDMIESFARRWPLAELVVAHCRVQGDKAVEEIAEAIRRLDALHAGDKLTLDALIVGRGGGSSEDLNAFNAEEVAAAIHACRVPVVAAVGHEIDVTIADLVADARAETPSNAVTLITPSRAELLTGLAATRDRFRDALHGRVQNARRRLDLIAARPALTRPLDRIRRHEQRLDEFTLRLREAVLRRVQRRRDRMQAAAARLEAVSPLNVLQRGYSLTRTPDGRIVRSAAAVHAGDAILTTLADGEIAATVTGTSPAPDKLTP